jgi:hypothetical protein
MASLSAFWPTPAKREPVPVAAKAAPANFAEVSFINDRRVNEDFFIRHLRAKF